MIATSLAKLQTVPAVVISLTAKGCGLQSMRTSVLNFRRKVLRTVVVKAKVGRVRTPRGWLAEYPEYAPKPDIQD